MADNQLADAEKKVDAAASESSVVAGKVLTDSESVTASIRALEKRLDKVTTALKQVIGAVRRQGFGVDFDGDA